MKQINLTIDDKNKMINIPDNWSDVTVKQYSDILKIKEDINDIQKRINTLSILLNIDSKIVECIDVEDFVKLEEVIKFIYTDMEMEKVDSIIIEGEEYFLYTDFNKLTIGEQMSISMITEKSNNNLLSVYSELLCLFLRKKENGKFETFNSEHMNRKEIFDKAPIAKVNQLLVFFSAGEPN